MGSQAEPLKPGSLLPSSGWPNAPVVPLPLQPEEKIMLKFIGGTIGAIFLIGLIVVVLLLMLIF